MPGSLQYAGLNMLHTVESGLLGVRVTALARCVERPDFQDANSNRGSCKGKKSSEHCDR